MNPRKLKRAKTKHTKKTSNKRKHQSVTATALQFARHGTTGSPRIDCLGNFIFFSTLSGEAWLLDYRGNRALRLTDGFKRLPYKIVESKERVAIEWQEQFEIREEYFIAIKNEEQRIYKNYPTKEIRTIIDMLQGR